MRIVEDMMYGDYIGHNYRVLTSKSVLDIYEDDYHILEVEYEDINELMQESISILSKYGYDYNDDKLDFRINFDDSDIIFNSTIENVFQRFVDDMGADLVMWDTGNIGFVFYRSNIIKAVEILELGGDNILDENLAMNNVDIVSILDNIKSDKFREYINSYYGNDCIQASVDIATALNSITPRSAIAEPVKTNDDIVIKVMNKEYALNNKEYKTKLGNVHLSPSENYFNVLEMLKN